MSQENFRVRLLSSADELAEVFYERSAKLHWNPGALDHVSFFAADNTGFFAGEMDGKVISCISVVKYTAEYAHVGSFIVDESHRGKGYGLRTWKAAISSLTTNSNIALDTHETRVSMYASSGFKKAWSFQRMIIKPSKVALESFYCSTEGLSIKPATEVQFDKLFNYDTSVYAFPRLSFLKKWISAENCYSYAVIDTGGVIVGYGVIRSAHSPVDSWRIGPLFANNSEIARNLFKSIILKVLEEDPTATIKVDVPYGELCNQDAPKIVTELSAEMEVQLHRMYTKGLPPNLLLTKIFGITSPELG